MVGKKKPVKEISRKLNLNSSVTTESYVKKEKGLNN